jgi:hypothetical protein
MHKGKVREMGTHQQLLAQRGIYYKLYQLQYRDQEIAGVAVPQTLPVISPQQRQEQPLPGAPVIPSGVGAGDD